MKQTKPTSLGALQPFVLSLDWMSQSKVVDPCWGITGKEHWSNDCSPRPSGAQIRVFKQNFDAQFLAENPWLWEVGAIVSLYGDEATDPAMAFAVQAQKPSAIVPCNECVHFFPPLNQTYEAYCEALMNSACHSGGRFQLVLMEGVPFSRDCSKKNRVTVGARPWAVGREPDGWTDRGPAFSGSRWRRSIRYEEEDGKNGLFRSFSIYIYIYIMYK
ncbi:unnamed protein product [Durusdinium trenchii]|uniref:Uncharacterized protein n=1 Tax=Durusdinium trenchii TaxID=1381693 RepID=A0ABP0S758_9DINO